jgi:hypothetical protein
VEEELKTRERNSRERAHSRHTGTVGKCICIAVDNRIEYSTQVSDEHIVHFMFPPSFLAGKKLTGVGVHAREPVDWGILEMV